MGCATVHIFQLVFFCERNHSILSSGVDKGTVSVPAGKYCILKEPKQHMEAPTDTAEAPPGQEICHWAQFIFHQTAAV